MLTTSIHLAKPANDGALASRLTCISLHGVRHMSCNGRGDVFWKGVYLINVKNVGDDQHFDVIQELGLLCHHLEQLGIKVNASTAGTHGTWFKDMRQDEPYKVLLSRCPDIYVGRDKLLIRFRRAACEFDGKDWVYYVVGSPEWCDRWMFRNLKTQGYACESLARSELAHVLDCLKHFSVPCSVLDIMADNLNPRSVT